MPNIDQKSGCPRQLLVSLPPRSLGAVNLLRIQMITLRDLCCNVNRLWSCKSAILKKSSSDCCRPLAQHLKGAIFTFPCFARWCRDVSEMRWENKSTFDSILSLQHFCQKLSISV